MRHLEALPVLVRVEEGAHLTPTHVAPAQCSLTRHTMPQERTRRRLSTAEGYETASSVAGRRTESALAIRKATQRQSMGVRFVFSSSLDDSALPAASLARRGPGSVALRVSRPWRRCLSSTMELMMEARGTQKSRQGLGIVALFIWEPVTITLSRLEAPKSGRANPRSAPSLRRPPRRTTFSCLR